MVPLEDRIDYLSRINESHKLTAFNNLLLAKKVVIPKDQDLNESEEIYFGIINAIQISNKVDFEKYYNKKNKSKPNKDSPAPFVNDDFLMFSFIVGVVKFEMDKDWLYSIVSIKNKNAITVTFENILNENYYSTSNLPEIVFMFLQLRDHALITNEFINFTFKKVTENIELFQSRSDFRILCSLRAYDSILRLKESPDKSELDMFKKFNGRFIKRITYLSQVIHVVLFGLLIYVVLKLPTYSPEAIVFIEQYNFGFTIFGALGLSFLGNFIPIFKNKSQESIMRLLGYPNELVKKSMGK
ncbi:hypothetical protein SAMN05444143_110110 [Flavobacterium succinicans]|jgi:ABC-type multidrug transport system fused ATPase/permease subunit|uniref:Uncharacterized protein n=1 Tax=Flavobacterium succinicans TaxID=29536 RepID=A0A1I4Y4D6_9FLAO|nr:hypothetical protein [Flavobacterium succinicans]SFN32926.1 hypothetical protein SAMN05444143_110110 [Flavobacterium succinicans]